MPAVGEISDNLFGHTKACESRQSRKRKKMLDILARLSAYFGLSFWKQFSVTIPHDVYSECHFTDNTRVFALERNINMICLVK